jgi:CheY-like chemotaxis protein
MPLRPTILVIDNEPASRHFLRKVLANAGYKVVEASTGAEAMDRISTNNCEMIVLDPALSDMDGLDVICGVRQQTQMPVIVLSTRDDVHSKIRALDLGADDYLTKPFAEGELLARMRAALRHRFQAKGEEPNFVSGDLVAKTNPELQEEKEPGFERIFASACRMSSGVHGTSSARHFAREIRAKWPTPLSEWQRAINSSMSGAVRRPASTAANGMTSLHFSSFKWLSSGPSSVSISLRSGYQPSTTAFAVRYS